MCNGCSRMKDQRGTEAILKDIQPPICCLCNVHTLCLQLINHPLLLYNARFVFFFFFTSMLNLVVVSSEACDKFCPCIFSMFKVKTVFYF